MAENTWSRCSFSYENIVVLMPWTSKYIIIVDLSTEAVVDCIKAEFPADYYRNKNGGYLFEGERDIKLKDYLETICCNAI